MNIKIDKLIWFIHARDKTKSLGFIRTSNNGAIIIGGKTGSHKTGHGENYWDKIKEIISLNYLPVDVARDIGILPEDWKEPIMSRDDERMVNGN